MLTARKTRTKSVVCISEFNFYCLHALQMCRLLESIVRNFKQSVRQPEEEEDEYSQENFTGAMESDEREVGESESYFHPTEPNGNTLHSCTKSSWPNLYSLPESPQPVILPSATCILPSVAAVPIKEGMVEKRGHSAKYLMFSR